VDAVQKRREAFEQELLQKEKERREEEKQRELEQHGEWTRQEERFFAEQLRRRSAIRIREGREQPIDVLAKNVLVLESGVYDDPDS